MSRRSMVGAGLVVLGAGVYLTGPTDRGGDIQPPSSPSLAVATSTASPPPSSNLPPVTTPGTAPATATASVAAAMATPPKVSPSPLATAPQTQTVAPALAAATEAKPEAKTDAKTVAATAPGNTTPANTTPRMINGPALNGPGAATPKSATRPLPSEGPRNGDVPPPAATGKSGPAPVVITPVAPAPAPPRVIEGQKATPKGEIASAPNAPRGAAQTPKRMSPKVDRTGVIVSAEAQPAPRANPPPRVQW